MGGDDAYAVVREAACCHGYNLEVAVCEVRKVFLNIFKKLGVDVFYHFGNISPCQAVAAEVGLNQICALAPEYITVAEFAVGSQ